MTRSLPDLSHVAPREYERRTDRSPEMLGVVILMVISLVAGGILGFVLARAL
jgi:hypothetical protein